MKNPQTTFLPPFLTQIIARIDGVKGLLLSESKIEAANGPPGPPIPPALHIYNGCNHKIHITNLLITNTLSRGPCYIMCQVLLHKVSPSDIWFLILYLIEISYETPKNCQIHCIWTTVNTLDQLALTRLSAVADRSAPLCGTSFIWRTLPTSDSCLRV